MADLLLPPRNSPPWSPPPPVPVPYREQRYYVSDSQVLASLYVNIVWGVLCIFGFVVLRGWVRGPGGVFQRRQELQDLFMRPPRLLLGSIRQVWNWMMPLLAVSDSDIIRCGGYDALVLTRVLLIGLQLFTVMSVLGLVVLIPVYYTRGGLEESPATVGAMARMSVANIPSGSVLFVLPFCMTYFFIGYGCWVLWTNCKCYAQLRQAYFLCLDALPTEQQLLEGKAGSAGRAAAVHRGAGAGDGAKGASQQGKSWTSSAGGPIAECVEEATNGASGSAAAAAAAAAAARPASPSHGDGAGSSAGAAGISGAASGSAGALSKPSNGGGEAAAGKAVGDSYVAPHMSLRSAWLNLANFFNPSLRMMLDYLDWMNPEQRNAATVGIRRLQLPTLLGDEAPEYARLYGNADHMVEYDDRADRDLHAAALAEGDADCSAGARGTMRQQEEAEGQGGGGGVDCSEVALEDGSLPAVLPYWRPLKVLSLLRRGSGAAAAAAPTAAAPPPGPNAGFVRRGGVRGGGGSADGPLANPASSTHTSIASTSYGLRHGEATSAAPAVAYADPLQPLLPGKRNIRLLQLLQVPVELRAGGRGLGRQSVQMGMAPQGQGAPVCVVNASHYVVLIKRVCIMRGPELIDRMAALTYIIVNRMRVDARRSQKAAQTAATAIPLVAQGAVKGGAAERAAGAPPGEAPGGTQQAADVEVPACVQKRGRAKVIDDVKRYYKMFHYIGQSPAGEQIRPKGSVGGEQAHSVDSAAAAASVPAVGIREAAFREEGSELPTSAAAEAALAQDAEEAANTDTLVDPNGAAVASVLRELFPTSFQGLIPVSNHDPVDKLVYRWDSKMLALEAAVRDLTHLEQRLHLADVEARGGSDAGGGSAAAGTAGCGGGGGGDGDAKAKPRVAKAQKTREAITKLKREIKELEQRIEEKRASVVAAPLGSAYFAVFDNSQDAQMLAQCRRALPPQGPGSLVAFDALPAPAPDDVSWPALWSTGTTEQLIRQLAIVIPMFTIFAIPIGPLQGVLSSLDVSLCGAGREAGDAANKFYTEWFCNPKNNAVRLIKLIITGLLPSVLGLVWTSFCMPHLLYICSSASRRLVLVVLADQHVSGCGVGRRHVHPNRHLPDRPLLPPQPDRSRPAQHGQLLRPVLHRARGLHQLPAPAVAARRLHVRGHLPLTAAAGQAALAARRGGQPHDPQHPRGWLLQRDPAGVHVRMRLRRRRARHPAMLLGLLLHWLLCLPLLHLVCVRAQLRVGWPDVAGAVQPDHGFLPAYGDLQWGGVHSERGMATRWAHLVDPHSAARVVLEVLRADLLGAAR